MKKLTFLSTLILLMVFTASGQTRSKIKSGKNKKPASRSASEFKREKFDPLRNPKNDLQTAVTRAKKENKRIILDIGGEWCGWCIQMDKFLAANSGLGKIRDENFVWLKVNMSPENENKSFLAGYPEIKGYPHLYVLEKDGAFLHSQNTAELEQEESYNLQKFTDFLKKWSPAKDTKKNSK